MMSLLFEDEIYLATKSFLKDNGWKLIAGQPPSGCDNLPVVQIKSPGKTGLGSRGVYKPDLIAAKNGVFMLVECKPDHSPSDINKLRQILHDDIRKSLLFDDLQQRRLLQRRGIVTNRDEFASGLAGAVAHSGVPVILPDLYVISVKRNKDGFVVKVYPPKRD